MVIEPPFNENSPLQYRRKSAIIADRKGGDGMFRYETHLHTFPVSRCGKVSVEENLKFYKEKGYDGVFITNHFLDGNINFDKTLPYEEGIEFYFSDYEKALELGKEIGIKVFLGVELAYGGSDFLIYGLEKEWYLRHPEIMEMKKSEELRLMMDEGALVIHAHPFREAKRIDHIRLYPRCVHGVEIINACRSEEENEMARLFAEHYGLLSFAGSDNHFGKEQPLLAGLEFETPLQNEADFVRRVKNNEMKLFTQENA